MSGVHSRTATNETSRQGKRCAMPAVAPANQLAGVGSS